ncbi:hypothetical protein JCM5350_000960 [Sporobolomyces pararoseus]
MTTSALKDLEDVMNARNAAHETAITSLKSLGRAIRAYSSPDGQLIPPQSITNKNSPLAAQGSAPPPTAASTSFQAPPTRVRAPMFEIDSDGKRRRIPGAPKHGTTAYMFFCKAKRATGSYTAQELGAAWKKADALEKKASTFFLS